VEDNKDKNKIILKRSALPGVDMSISDFTQIHTIKVVWSKVTKKMYKEYKQTFIGLKDKLDAGDVIRVGNLGLSYRVIKLSKFTEKEGFIHRVQRLDGNSTTLTDINAIELGDKVSITSRRSFEQMINYACSMREENPIESTINPCDEPSVCDREYEDIQVFQYEFCSPGSETSGYDSVEITYKNEEGVSTSVTVSGCVFDGKTPCPGVCVGFCAQYGTILIDLNQTPVYASNEDCPNTAPCTQEPRLTKVGNCPL
jgi:hypothetical protein